MNKIFEYEFMDLQSALISLCMEVSWQKVGRIYAYCSNEKETCSAQTGKSAGKIFSEWMSEIRRR